jgi:hypothetical protein
MLRMHQFQRSGRLLDLRRLAFIVCAVTLLFCGSLCAATPKLSPLRTSREPPWRMDSVWCRA